MSDGTTSAQILRSAANLIRQHGHCKRAYVAEDGRLCAVGAMAKAHTGPIRAYHEARVAFSKFLEHRSVTEWNDAPERTPDEVITALEAAAASLEAAP